MGRGQNAGQRGSTEDNEAALILTVGDAPLWDGGPGGFRGCGDSHKSEIMSVCDDAIRRCHPVMPPSPTRCPCLCRLVDSRRMGVPWCRQAPLSQFLHDPCSFQGRAGGAEHMHSRTHAVRLRRGGHHAWQPRVFEWGDWERGCHH
jgi:hypothetical protein